MAEPLCELVMPWPCSIKLHILQPSHFGFESSQIRKEHNDALPNLVITLNYQKSSAFPYFLACPGCSDADRRCLDNAALRPAIEMFELNHRNRIPCVAGEKRAAATLVPRRTQNELRSLPPLHAIKFQSRKGRSKRTTAQTSVARAAAARNVPAPTDSI